MKIGLCGAGGTGKSTLAQHLSLLSHLPLMLSPSRECFAKHGVRAEDDQRKLSPEKRMLLQLDIFGAITRQSRENDIGIFDRTNLDNLFYGYFQCNDVILDSEVEDMYTTTVKELRKFDLIVFCPIYAWANKAADDGMRTRSFASRMIMSKFVKGFLISEGIDHISATNHSPQARAEIVNDLIKGRLEGTSSYEQAFKGGR